jgi:16S rRNA (guanine966-N2)-methyltransferase
MRITGGKLGGRRLEAAPGIRPTQDKVRQAIFSALGARVVDARALDLFAGTGSLGLEAASRGAASVCWVESNARAAARLRKTVESLCPSVGRVVQADALAWLRRAAFVESFDLVFADPPYDRAGTQRWMEKTLPLLERGPIVVPGGLLVFEMSAAESPVERLGWRVVWDRLYGDTRVSMLERTESKPL